MESFEMTVPKVPGLSRMQIEQSALEFLMVVAPECLETPMPVPVRKIFEDMLDIYDYKAMVGKNIKGLEGITNVTSRVVTLNLATYNRLEKDDPRARFTCAHEFGHMILHGQYQISHSAQSTDVMFARRSQLKAYEDPEWQSDTFGAALLMPYPMMKLLFKNGEMEVDNVMQTFQVSRTAAMKRITKLQTEFIKK